MKTPWMRINLIVVFSLMFHPVVFAEEWSGHIENIERIEKSLYKFQQELDVLVETKKKTRDRARIEETLQRIVEVHAELISLRKDLDTERDHLKKDHPDMAHVLDSFDTRVKPKSEKKYTLSPLDSQLDNLLIKVKLKFASFMEDGDQKKEMVEVKKVVEVKKRKKKEREADVYLRRKSKVKLVK